MHKKKAATKNFIRVESLMIFMGKQSSMQTVYDFIINLIHINQSFHLNHFCLAFLFIRKSVEATFFIIIQHHFPRRIFKTQYGTYNTSISRKTLLYGKQIILLFYKLKSFAHIVIF